ncbi:MAG: ABC transporter ATP-binding protein [Janthinobacterium lividum]
MNVTPGNPVAASGATAATATAAASAPLFEVERLASGYGRIPILGELSFTVRAGEHVGILGHNGMGKTTLLRTLTGHLPTTSGRVRFAGQDITHLSPTARAKAGIGYVPQGREIFPALTVRDNLRVGCLLARGREDETIAGILELFPRLKAYLDRAGGALSGGEQQLLALARCLCASPRIVLLDEPTEGIQPSIIDEIIDTLKDVARQRDLTILLVEQNLNFISSLSDRILILQKGTVTREIPPDVVHDPALLDEFVGIA